ncbi:hypothetical protein [Brevibacillus porteri]|uniref:hypothetical protein n=1 Tax=Brevibacillus porteri TaxID=2126350 RepID=UPI001FC9E30B|nr:hypothetical protein [Brevibacillus porteri]MED1799546.1 hypothetical protein [Brevibacillus porteri]MED2131857.1 hypothetical protein [Brevibacillus porteri]MED2743542.1 hypothetical protein [Brevibacillus porteri]MED2815550.1 hypothetical protein [Brevibacillus porteri]MED2896284.1 hypothetical protein [Brevibacillus porteri]
MFYHVGNSNRHALGICLVGDFRTQQPTPERLEVPRLRVEKLPCIPNGRVPNKLLTILAKSCGYSG